MAIHVLNDNNVRINPVTEDKQDDVIAGLASALAVQAGTVGDEMTSTPVNLAAGAQQEVIATPGAGHQLWVYGYELHANAGGTVQFHDESDTAATGIMPVGANGGMAIASPYPLFKLATNKALELSVVTSEIDGVIQYRDVTL